MHSTSKEKWYTNEALVAKHFVDQGYEIIGTNYTIKGGEIDIIIKDKDDLIFVEVKTVDHIDDIYGYVTTSKIKALERSIDSYIQRDDPEYKNIRLLFIFVKDSKIIEIYEQET